MATTDKNTIYSYFQTDDFPTEEQFRATWDSFWHKSESIPMSQISGLNQMFVNTATVAQLNAKADVYHTHPDLEDSINDLQSGLDSQVIVNENQDELLQTLESSLNALNLWKSQMTSADADNLVNTLSELLAVFQSVPEGTDVYGLLAAKVNVSDIVNNLTSVDTTKVLSANQGKLLKDLIDSLNSTLSLKQDRLSSFDESVLIENNGNIESNVSLFTDYFNVQNCILSFTPIQILGVYKNGIKLLPSQYHQPTLKNIVIDSYTNESIEIQYTHLKIINLWP